jgi:hypothetical protein
MQMTREQFNHNEQVPTDFLTLDQRTHLAGLDTNRFAGDDRLHVRFFTKPTLNQFRTELEGRPIYEDLEYIEIWIPGDKSNINVRPIQLDDKMRFKKRYDDWKAGVSKQTGTPLKLMPFLSESAVEELAYFRITTVEQLANVADSTVQNMHGLTGYKRQAQEYLDTQNNSGAMLERIRELEQRLNDQQAKMLEQAVTAAPAARKGKTEKPDDGMLG